LPSKPIRISEFSWRSNHPRRKGVKFGPHPTPAIIRFWEKVNKNGPIPANNPSLGRCWLWTGTTAKGYGAFLGDNQKQVTAYGFLWIRKHGPIPRGKELDHLCRNKLCVRDSHVEPVTHRLNLLRGNTFVARQRCQTSCVNGHSLTEENIYRWHGHRLCRMCRRERNQCAQARRRGA